VLLSFLIEVCIVASFPQSRFVASRVLAALRRAGPAVHGRDAGRLQPHHLLLVQSPTRARARNRAGRRGGRRLWMVAAGRSGSSISMGGECVPGCGRHHRLPDAASAVPAPARHAASPGTGVDSRSNTGMTLRHAIARPQYRLMALTFFPLRPEPAGRATQSRAHAHQPRRVGTSRGPHTGHHAAHTHCRTLVVGLFCWTVSSRRAYRRPSCWLPSRHRRAGARRLRLACPGVWGVAHSSAATASCSGITSLH